MKSSHHCLKSLGVIVLFLASFDATRVARSDDVTLFDNLNLQRPAGLIQATDASCLPNYQLGGTWMPSACDSYRLARR